MGDRRERKERQDKTKGRVPVMVTRRRCLRLCYLKLCIDCAFDARFTYAKTDLMEFIISLSKPFKKMLPKYNLPCAMFFRRGESPYGEMRPVRTFRWFPAFTYNPTPS